MLTAWLQSIMTSAITTKVTGKSKRVKVLSKEYRETRDRLMKMTLAQVWEKFACEFPGETSAHEDLTADMIILIRNQLAHCHISPGNEFALFLPKPSSQRLLDKLKTVGWVETPIQGETDPEMLIMREDDKEWLDRNTKMILGFAENSILRITRAHGMDDFEMC